MTKMNIKGLSLEQLERSLKSSIIRGQYTLETSGDEVFLWIKDIPAQESSGNLKAEHATVKDVEDLAGRLGVQVKRKYTKRKDWKDPTRSKDHDANRAGKRLNVRVDDETNKLVEEFLSANNMTKTELTILALNDYICHRTNDI